MEHWRNWKSPRHVNYVQRQIEADILPCLGARPLAEIRAPEIVNMIRALEERGTSPSLLWKERGKYLGLADDIGHLQSREFLDVLHGMRRIPSFLISQKSSYRAGCSSTAGGRLYLEPLRVTNDGRRPRRVQRPPGRSRCSQAWAAQRRSPCRPESGGPKNRRRPQYESERGWALRAKCEGFDPFERGSRPIRPQNPTACRAKR